MEITTALVIDFLFVMIGVICVMLAATVASMRQGPYTQQDFFAAMERIGAGVEELRTLLDEAAFCGPEVIANLDGRELRAKCRGIMNDMLRNACFVVSCAEPCCRTELERAEINRCAGEVVRQGLRLILHVRWSSLWLAFRVGAIKTCEQTMRAAEKYTVLWVAVIAFLEARFPECHEALLAPGNHHVVGLARDKCEGTSLLVP